MDLVAEQAEQYLYMQENPVQLALSQRVQETGNLKAP